MVSSQLRERIKRVQMSDQGALRELLRRYEPLIHSMARTYTAVEDATQWVDYVQEGYMGLLEALRRYDTEKGISFGAYAKPFVKHRMAALWASARGLNDYQHTQYKKVRRQHDAFFDEHGRPPSEEELADAIEAEYDFRPRMSTLRTILRSSKGTVPIYADIPLDTTRPGFVPATEPASYGLPEAFDVHSTLYELARHHLDEQHALSFVALHVLCTQLGLEYKDIRRALEDADPLLPANEDENPDVPEEGLYWHQHHERLQLPGWLSNSWREVCGWFKKSNGGLLGADALRKRFTYAAKDLEHYVKTQDLLKSEGISPLLESENIERLSEWFGKFERLMKQAIDVFGSEEKARKWFETPLPALGGKTPFEYADTEPGAREVEDVLGRIAHGIFS